jgi:hypothetical protein
MLLVPYLPGCSSSGASPAQSPLSTSPLTPPPAPLEARLDDEINAHSHPPAAPLVVHFNRPVASGDEPPLELTPHVEGEFTWNKHFTRLTFTPAQDLVPGRSYHVRVREDLHGAGGQRATEPIEWYVRIMPPPSVIHREPRSLRIAERRPHITLEFSHEMDRRRVASALSVEPSVPLTLSWQANVLHIEPLEPLTPGTTYHFRLAPSASDVHGTLMRGETMWDYHMEELLAEPTWPFRQRERSTPLVLRFNYPVDPASLERALSIEPPISGRWGWNDGHTVATLTPTLLLPNETTYTLRFEQPLLDADDIPLPPIDPLQFVTPPPILATTPDAGGNEVHPATAVRVTFDRPMDPVLTGATFAITPTVAGELEWEETTLIFYPEAGGLQEHTSYTVRIGTGAAGIDGEPVLNRPYAWSFYTGEFEDVASFGWGPNAQVVDAAGRRAVQFSTLQSHPTALNFELYRLNVVQFLDRYASGFRGVRGHERRPIRTDDLALAHRWQVNRGGHSRGGVHETVLPGEVVPGLYVLNLTAGHVNDQLILLVTHNTLVLKQAEGQIVAWVTDINGGPVAGIDVEVYARDGQRLAQGISDANGVFRTAVSRDPQPLIVIARSGDDVTASGLSNEWRTTGTQWWGWWRPAPVIPRWTSHIYTERPIYRPGQTVFFKGFIRRDADAVLSLPPAGTPVTVRIRDARNNVVQTLELATNAFGSVHGEFQLAEGAMLGEYAVEMVMDGESHRQAFKVEDYRKPDYQVTVTPERVHYVAGETITVEVDSRYFFGEPVANAALTVRQYELAERMWWDESDTPYAWAESYRREIEGTTDADGRFTFTLQATRGDYASRYYWWAELEHSTWGIEVSLDDGSHQPVSNFAVVQVHSAAAILRLDTNGYFKTPGQPFTVHAGVETIAGEPVSGRSLRLTLCRYSREANDYTHVVQALNLTSDERGEISASLTVDEPGYYRLRVTGIDRLGNSLSSYTHLYVFDRTGRWRRRSTSLRITAEREQYAPGETARLMIESPFSGPALLTFERGTTRREQPVELTAPLTVVEVPILPEDVPNIFITVNAWEEQDTTFSPDIRTNLPDSRLHTASVELRVPATDRQLTVTLTPDRETYAPGDEATFTVRVTNARGEPVSAEVSMALVDEAIFSLSEDLAGHIFDGFYYERDHIVRTYDALSLVRYLPGGEMGGGGGGGGYTAANPRSEFPDTAAWFPALHTDWNGEASITLTLPDNLTTWRMTAKAATVDTQVGEARVEVVTHQPIVVRPLLPRGLTAGDQAVLSAVVHNYSDRTREVAVSLVCGETCEPLLGIVDPVTQTIVLAPEEVRVVGWQAAARAAGSAPVVVAADAGSTGDAVRLDLAIRPLAVADVAVQVGDFSDAWHTEVFMPTDALDTSSVRLELSRSVAGSLLTGLEFLTGYPYGCVEQTMSRALPNAVVGRAFHQLGETSSALQDDLDPKINASLQRLYGYQHNDGGWGWWYDDASHTYQTAWVVFGLAMTAEAGYEVDPQVIERGTAWLADHLEGMEPRTRAYALYSMAVAGHGNLDAARALAHDAQELDVFSRAALALALHRLGDVEQAQGMVDALAAEAHAEDGVVYWPGAEMDGRYRGKAMASQTRSTALVLSAFAQIQPGHELEPGIARWLMGRRREYGWGNTNETAFVILALTDHLVATEQTTLGTTYSVELNGETYTGGTLGRGEPAVSLEIPAAALARGRNTLHVRQSGGGYLYYTLSRRAYLPQAEIEAAGEIQISRTYLDAHTGRRIESAEPGQLVRVQIQVRLPEDSFYMLIEDSLPGGLEALNERLNTTSHEERPEQEPYYAWEQRGYNHKEVHGDRVSFFVTEMEEGQHTFEYLARATHAGRFVALPVEVSAMYELSRWGRSASDRLVVVAPGAVPVQPPGRPGPDVE